MEFICPGGTVVVTHPNPHTLATRGLEELRVNLLLKENSYVSNIILHGYSVGPNYEFIGSGRV